MPTEEEIKAFAAGNFETITHDQLMQQAQTEQRFEEIQTPQEQVNEPAPQVVEPPIVTPAEPIVEQQPSEPVVQQAEAPEAILEKISEGKIKSTEELKALLEKANTPQEDITSIAKSLDAAVKNGLNPKDWAAQQLVDVDSYSTNEIVKEYFKQTKGWTDKKAQEYLEAKFFINEQYDDGDTVPREVVAARFELEDIAQQAKQHFNSQKIDLDNFSVEIPRVKELETQLFQINQQRELERQANEKLAEYIDSSLKDFNSYSFKYNYTDTNAQEAADEVGLKLTEEQVKRGANMLKNPQLLIEALTNGGKDMDVKKLVAKINLLADDKLFSEMFADTRARSTEAVIKKLKNVGAPSIPTVNPKNYDISEERNRIQQILKDMPVQR